MAEHVEALEGEDLLGKHIDEGMRLLPSVLPSKSQFTALFTTDVTPPVHSKSSLSIQSSSKCLPSPSARAIYRKNLFQQEQIHRNKHRSSIAKASILGNNVTNISSHDSSYDASLSAASRTVAGRGRPEFAQAGHLFNFPINSSLKGIQKSAIPVKRKLVTPITIRQHQRHCTKSLLVEPFKILEALERRLRTSSQVLQPSDELRRLELAINIHHCTKIPRAVLPRIGKIRVVEQSLVPNINELGLGMLAIVEDQPSCSFCVFECIYGSSDKEVLLPASASYHRCLNCDPSELFIERDWAARITRNSLSAPTIEQRIDASLRMEAQYKFQVLIKSLSGSNFYIDVKASDKVVDLKKKVSQYISIKWDSHHLYSRGAILRDQRSLSAYQIGPRSLIEIIPLKYIGGCDVTQFWRPNFCSSCLWTQVDVKLAKICLPCVNEKIAIVRHSHHGNWIPFFHIVHGASGNNPTTNNTQGNCMVCTKLARAKCAGCPLVVCLNCSTHLDATSWRRSIFGMMLFCFDQMEEAFKGTGDYDFTYKGMNWSDDRESALQKATRHGRINHEDIEGGYGVHETPYL